MMYTTQTTQGAWPGAGPATATGGIRARARAAMNRTRPLAEGTALLVLLSLGGCALTTKATPTVPRYFSPEPPDLAPKAAVQRSAIELRLGRISAGSHIREKIAYRNSQYEMGFYDELLWTEKPDAYLRRALTQALFEESGLRSVVGGPAPTLDVELVSFEEIRAPRHLALVRVMWVLRDDRVVRSEQTLTVELPIGTGTAAAADKTPAGSDASDIAAKLGEALRSAVTQIRERVLSELSRPPTQPPPPPPAK